MEQLIEFGIFSGKLVLIFMFFVGIIVVLVGLIAKQKLKPDLQVEDLNEKYQQIEKLLNSVLLDKKDLKKLSKEEKRKLKQDKEAKKEGANKNKIFVLQFEGDVKATRVDQLRDEITSVLMVSQPGDEVVINIESPGGTVHGYGLAAAQILRLKSAGLVVTACVDKVAASGGYMMACTANKIIAAPFAIIGSIGVLAQVPNIHRLLKKNDVDYEEISAGDYKRTVSVLGQITEKGRQKFTEQITDTHNLFKEFVSSQRPIVDIQKVATGEYWFATRALEFRLVDEIMTSDAYLLKNKETSKIFSIRFTPKKHFSEKINDLLGSSVDRIFLKFMDWSNSSRHL